METKTINVYKYDELSETAKEKALSNFNDNNEHNFLSDYLNEELNYHLEENKIKVLSDKRLFFSLSCSQGDGVCFVGNFEFKGMKFFIDNQNHRYYHKHATYIEIEEYDFENEKDDLKADIVGLMREEIKTEFKQIYIDICDKIEKNGYSQIEYEESEENFKEMCDANEYTFLENGEMENF